MDTDAGAADVPLASIVIPVWNRAESLGRAVASVLTQSDTDLEVVVVDNGSDDTEAVRRVVAALADPRVRVERSDTNLGPSGGRNLGASVARGPLLGFLDSDDEFESSWLATLAGAFEDERCGVVTCGYRRVQPDGSADAPVLPEPLGTAHLDAVGRFQAGTILVRRDLFLAVGGYDDRFWFSENTDLGLRLCAGAASSGLAVRAVAEPLLRWHDDGAARDYDRPRLEAAELMLTVHAGVMRLDSEMYERHLAVAGVTAARLGEWGRSRRHLWALVRHRPSPLNIGRLALACVPPVARRRWARR